MHLFYFHPTHVHKPQVFQVHKLEEIDSKLVAAEKSRVQVFFLVNIMIIINIFINIIIIIIIVIIIINN